MPIKNKILADIRSDVCDTVLGWTLVVGSVAIAISLSRIIQFGWMPVMGLHIGLEFALIPIYYFRKRLPFAVRAGAILAVMYLVGIGGHISFGTPTRIEFFISASIMAAVFFGERAGLISAGTTILCIAAIYAAHYFNLIPPPMTEGYAMSATAWITNAASSLVAALAPLVAVTRYRNHLELERQRAEAANAAKSDFLAMMSHELRTPMTAILGISDLLLSEQLSADLTNKISWISKSGRLLLGLLNDALDFSKIEARHLVIEQAVFHPRELFRDIQNLFTPLAAEKKLILHVHFADILEDRLISDAARLRQVVVNLVGNAVKFTEHGHVDVRVAQEYQNGNQLMLTVQVSDTGIGISRQQQARLFQPFMQANQGTSRRYGGTGLGLAISRRIVELMGGQITVSSEENQGTTFTFSVPVLADMGESALSLLSKPSHPPQNPPQGLRILVAEDDETIAFLLQTMLVRWGNTVDVVGDGGAAVTAMQSQTYDIVLMDMQMPNVDGASATRAIKQLDGKTGGIPVIALTADVSARNQEDLLSSGVSALLSKPINWVELSSEIGRHVPTASPPNKRNAPQPAALSQNNTAVLDEVVLARLKQDVGGENFPAMLDKFADGLDQYAQDFSDAMREGDITKLKRLAHSFRGVSQQFGAIHAAGLAISISAASAATEAQPLVTRLLEGLTGLKKSIQAYRIYTALPDRRAARERRRRLI